VSRFRRKRDEHAADADLATEPLDEALDDAAPAESEPTERARPQGPWDVADLPEDDQQTRFDLGSLRLPGFEGMEMQVNVDEASGTVLAVTAVHGDTALQVQPFAAPRREGVWDEIRAEIAQGITADGGTSEEVDGPFGIELRAKVPVREGAGTPRTVPVRFLGVDGPRWFLRGVLTGPGQLDRTVAARFEEVFRGTVVVRGGDPMAPREALPLRLPGGAQPETVEPPGGRPPLDLGTGQQITEIH